MVSALVAQSKNDRLFAKITCSSTGPHLNVKQIWPSNEMPPESRITRTFRDESTTDAYADRADSKDAGAVQQTALPRACALRAAALSLTGCIRFTRQQLPQPNARRVAAAPEEPDRRLKAVPPAHSDAIDLVVTYVGRFNCFSRTNDTSGKRKPPCVLGQRAKQT